jgi:hypothetical protein
MVSPKQIASNVVQFSKLHHIISSDDVEGFRKVADEFIRRWPLSREIIPVLINAKAYKICYEFFISRGRFSLEMDDALLLFVYASFMFQMKPAAYYARSFRNLILEIGKREPRLRSYLLTKGWNALTDHYRSYYHLYYHSYADLCYALTIGLTIPDSDQTLIYSPDLSKFHSLMIVPRIIGCTIAPPGSKGSSSQEELMFYEGTSDEFYAFGFQYDSYVPVRMSPTWIARAFADGMLNEDNINTFYTDSMEPDREAILRLMKKMKVVPSPRLPQSILDSYSELLKE